MRYRRSIIKWFLLAAGLLLSLVAVGRPPLMAYPHAILAGGCFIAFALLDACDRLAPLLGERKSNPPPAP